ncbi:transmembrane protein, putative [Medicago truncatula]|uniref:Transmembrane protein, putative n=2 Tax=Medicago truncatula TaxID=3880 RepID=G7INZ7_MEDTR|nr:transmembrane protein, putative [Medicago truncatula]
MSLTPSTLQIWRHRYFRHLNFIIFNLLALSHLFSLHAIKLDVVFDQFRLSDKLRSSADPINDFGVIHVADPDTWLLWNIEEFGYLERQVMKLHRLRGAEVGVKMLENKANRSNKYLKSFGSNKDKFRVPIYVMMQDPACENWNFN